MISLGSCDNRNPRKKFELSNNRSIEVSESKDLYLMKSKANVDHMNYTYRCKFYTDSLLSNLSFFYIFYEGKTDTILKDRSKYISTALSFYNEYFGKNVLLKSQLNNIEIKELNYTISELDDNTTIAFTIRDSLPEKFYFINRNTQSTINYLKEVKIITK